jgi:hypothetical protein
LGWPAEALTAFDRERAIRHRLGADRPGKDVDRDWLANCETNSAAALVALGQLPEAGVCCDRAIAIREDLVKRQTTNHRFQQNLAESLMRLGGVRAAAGDAAGAATLWRRAAATFAGHPPGGESAVFRACCHGALTAITRVASAGVSVADGAATPRRRWPSCAAKSRAAIAIPLSFGSNPGSTHCARATTSGR